MEPTSIQLSRYHLALAPVLVSNIFLPESFQNDSGHCKGDSRVYNSNKCRVYARYGGLLKWGTPKSSKLDHFTSIETMVLGISLKTHLYIWSRPPSLHPPPHGLGPQVVAPIPFYLQAIGSISEVQRRIC